MDNTNISKHLGKTSEYKSTYDPSLLVREPRQSNRSHLNIDDNNLPFVGYDTWNAYEVSGLLSNGTPFVAIAKIVYNCNNKYIVESKSLKLYLNSFNMTRSESDDVNLAVLKLTETIKTDLSSLLETDVDVSLALNQTALTESVRNSPFIVWGMCKYTTLENNVKTQCSVFTEDSSLLKFTENEYEDEYYLHSGLLKSNCRVTQQPDWGDVFIYYKGKREVKTQSLLQYIVSFRDECHFHEEICETIFQKLHQVLEPSELHVMCLYARRGGIDINPQRASSEDLLNKTLCDVAKIHSKTPKQ